MIKTFAAIVILTLILLCSLTIIFYTMLVSYHTTIHTSMQSVVSISLLGNSQILIKSLITTLKTKIKIIFLKSVTF